MCKSLDFGVVIPTLNSERFLEQTLFSLRELIQRGVSVVIVDSYSSDQTLEIAEKYNVVVIFEEPGNMYRAINKGIDFLSNEWVTYINSDDLLYVDSVLDAIFTLGESSDLIYGNIDYVDDFGRFLHGWRSPKASSIGSYLSVFNPFPQQGTLFRKSAWESLLGFDEQYRYSSDRDFFARFFCGGFRISKYAGKRIAAFRLHENQLSQAVNALMIEEARIMVAKWSLPELTYFRRCWLLSLVRLQNMDSYVIRVLRRYQMFNDFVFKKSIDV